MKEFKKAAAALREGRALMMVNVIKAEGSVPRSEGARLFVFPDGKSFGTVGGGSAEYAAVKEAAAKLKAGDRASFCREYVMHQDDAAELGMVCGGTLTLYFQHFKGEEAARCFEKIAEAGEEDKDAWLIIPVCPGREEGSISCFDRREYLSVYGISPAALDLASLMRSKPRLLKNEKGSFYLEPFVTQGRVLLFGGGHVAQALQPLLHTLAFKTLVFEDRPQFCTTQLFPEAEELLLGDFKAIDEKLEIRPGDYAVIMTRGHQADLEVLEQLLKKELRYIGMMGSKAKIKTVYGRLEEKGFGKEDFAKVHAPIGIKIASETPEEIAVSIAAELICCRNTK